MVLHGLGEVFGDALEFDTHDLFDGHYERVVQAATELGIGLDRPVVRCAARLVRELSPRYRFRLRVSEGAFVCGKVDRYAIWVQCESEADFPEPARSRFVEFLRSLRLGEVRVEA
jgi:hypothetical protein